MERVIKVGEKVRSYDFEPRADLVDQFVEGVVTKNEDNIVYIDVNFDSTGYARKFVTTSENLFFGEYNGRLSVIN